MVQKYQSPVRVYKYPFELVMRAYEMRFPTCDMIPVVKESEVIDEELSEDGSTHIIDRRAKLSVDMPYLLKKLMGVDMLLFRQRNSLDKRTRSLKIDAWNESFCNRVIINELCVYSVHPENSDWTCFEQSAELDIKSFFGFEGTAERIAINEYSKNIAKSKDIMECHIKVLADQGITYVPVWVEPEAEAKKDNDEDEENFEASTSEDSELKSKDTNLALKRKSFLRRRSSGVRGGVVVDGVETLHISDDATNKLEQDYIQMYLGELTPMQESKLVLLKNRVSDLLKGKVPRDPVFLRFLRAREFNVEKAREMLSLSLTWRKKHGVDKILSEYSTPQVVKEYFPANWHCEDKEGRPLFVLRLGQMDVKGLMKSVGEEGLIKLTLHICEEGLRRTEDAAHKLNKPISTWCLLLDLDGLNMRHLWRPGMKALLRIIEICEANYPETLGRVLIIRAPRVFPILWTLVSPLIDETSRGKFLFYGGNDYQNPGGLIDYMDPKLIPNWLSGPCVTEIPSGGLVPKSYYMSEEDFEKDQSPGPHFLDESFYHSTTLSKNHLHEGVIDIKEKGTVITWDFDVLRNDVLFTVFRLHVPHVPNVTAANSSGSTIPIVSVTSPKMSSSKAPVTTTAVSLGKETTTTTPATTSMASGSGAGSHNLKFSPFGKSQPGFHHEGDTRSVIEKSWRENVDYFKVEPSVLCHDGESIQGSHVASHIGTYVLQWKFFDRSHIGSPLDVLSDSISQHHKAKVMYFFETLSSADYRGSMSSLQSCQSAFSAISKASAKDSNRSSSGVSSNK